MKYLIGSLAFLISSIGFHAAHADDSGKFYVPINRSEIVNSPVPMGEVIVSNPEIADVYVHGKDKVSIIGRALGETSVRLFDEDNKLIRNINVSVTYDLPAIRKALHQFLPYQRIGVEMVNTRIALTGEVSSAEASDSAMRIVEEFLVPMRAPGVSTAAERAALSSPVINLLRVTAGQQVMLRIRVGEIKRGTLKRLGVGFNAVKNSGDIDFLLGSSTGNVIGSALSSTIGYDNGTNSLSATLDALERDSLIKVLAEPNLMAISGETAEFLAGGEIPVPTGYDSTSDQLTFELKPYGVAVSFTPYVLSENRIRIEVQPEVSDRNDAEGIQISGVNIPAFDVRKASTTVELAPGESFMIAGLIQDSSNSEINEVPGISEIPIFSSLFRNTNYEREETELVIAVTPYIVDPLKSNDIRTPADNFQPATFMEAIFYGALGKTNAKIDRLSQTPTVEGPIGFMVD